MAPNDTTAMAHPVVAAVCDIRGFTDFTAMVDTINRSDHVKRETKNHLLDDYKTLVKGTQETTINTLLEPIMSHRLPRGLPSPLLSALKSTGDGFLLAVSLYHEESGDPFDYDAQVRISELLVKGVLAVVNEADVGQIRDEIEGFIGMWGSLFGLVNEKKSKSPPGERANEKKLRVAGAVAIGTGTIDNAPIAANSSLAKAWEAVDKRARLSVKNDAFGHGINLAFRLCDRSGRKEGDVNSYVLLDRRVGQLLVKRGERKGRRNPYELVLRNQAISRVDFKEPLKGIDELWCYGILE